MKLLFAFLLVGLVPCAAQRTYYRDVQERAESLAPYVPSPQQIVDAMLGAAQVKSGELVYDLGCGDGRILITAAQRHKAKGVGIELSERLAKAAMAKVNQLRLDDQIQIIHGNLLEVDLAPADVVTIYLDTGSNDLLRPKLEKQLKTGARVVSHDFEVRGWKPASVDKIHVFNRHHTIYMYRMPPEKK
ncbi:MAG: SAM-dependent methyltransferase [Bryobacteraceae bacterium]